MYIRPSIIGGRITLKISEMKHEEAIKGVANALKQDILSLYELMYLNNPNSLVYTLRQMRLTDAVNPKQEEIEKIIKRLIVKKDIDKLRYIAYNVEPDNKINNFTNNMKLWELLGTPVGSFGKVFDMYIHNKNGN